MMLIKDIKDEDFVNYKKPSMFIAMGRCNFKCCRLAGVDDTVCQNYALHAEPDIEVDEHEIVDRYLSNPITQAVVLGGLDPMDDPESTMAFVKAFRKKSDDDIVIYTGYRPEQITKCVTPLRGYPNIIVKYGPYMPGRQSRFDDVLGVTLASNNQYSKRIG